jgi:hypothetical protein
MTPEEQIAAAHTRMHTVRPWAFAEGIGFYRMSEAGEVLEQVWTDGTHWASGRASEGTLINALEPESLQRFADERLTKKGYVLT